MDRARMVEILVDRDIERWRDMDHRDMAKMFREGLSIVGYDAMDDEALAVEWSEICEDRRDDIADRFRDFCTENDGRIDTLSGDIVSFDDMWDRICRCYHYEELLWDTDIEEIIDAITENLE